MLHLRSENAELQVDCFHHKNTQTTRIFIMAKRKKKTTPKKQNCLRNIKSVETTQACLTDRAGLVPLANFIEGSSIVDKLSYTFRSFRKSSKGISLDDSFFQLLLFFADGSHQTLDAFDELREDESWQKMLGVKESLGTAQLKRLLDKVELKHFHQLRPMIQRVFLKNLKEEQPDKVVLFLDSCVLDNDTAKCKGGSKPTYKNKKGYHPINLIWNGFYVDTVFQQGHHSTNHDNIVTQMLENIVTQIRETVGDETSIIVRMDAGYFDQKIFKTCDELKIKFVCAGKVYSKSSHSLLAETSLEDFDGKFQNGGTTWKYLKFAEQRQSWPKDMKYRAFFLRATQTDGEALLGLDTRIILTNLTEKEASDLEIIDYDHSRGADELTHRASKEFSPENLPCLDYSQNAFWYTLSILAFNLFQTFKRNIVCFPKNSYPNTLRRKFFDIAGRIVRKGRQLSLQITKWNMKKLGFDDVWRRSLIPWDLYPEL